MATIYTAYSDPGHGWLKVPVADIHSVGLSVLSFSQYSYFNKGYVYLEEDADAALFCLAYNARYGQEPVISHKISKGQSSIRRYPRLEGFANSYERQCEMIQYYKSIIDKRAA